MVMEARRSIIQIEAGITTYALRYKEKHPKMMAAKAALAEAKDKLRQAVVAQSPLMRSAIEQIKATEASLQQALQNQQGVAVNLNRTAIGYQELARQAETDRALYESVLRQIKETNLSKDVKANAVSATDIPRFRTFLLVLDPRKRSCWACLAVSLSVWLSFLESMRWIVPLKL